MLTFASISDMFIGMAEVRTSSETDSAIETSGGMTLFCLGIDGGESKPTLLLRSGD